jgi:glycerophosphoryl diester phosphodiesterase
VIRVIAHRGASRDRPENTLAAFDEALRQGCDGIELDVQLSRDEIPVVYHDRTLVRAGGGRRRLAELDWSELKHLGPGSRSGDPSPGLRLTSLDAVLARYTARTRLLVEIKTREAQSCPERHATLAAATAARVARIRGRIEPWLLSFDPDALSICRRVAPEVPRVLNVRTPDRLTAATRRTLPLLHALSIDVRVLSSRLAREAARTGLPLIVFTCNTPVRVATAVDAGASIIMSDRPRWLRRRLERTGAIPVRDARR